MLLSSLLPHTYPLIYLISLSIAQGPHQTSISLLKETILLLRNNEPEPSAQTKSWEEPKTKQGGKTEELCKQPRRLSLKQPSVHIRAAPVAGARRRVWFLIECPWARQTCPGDHWKIPFVLRPRDCNQLLRILSLPLP